MKLRFQLLIILILFSLLFAFLYQVYWLHNLYKDRLNQMEINIMTAMNNADRNSRFNPDFTTYNDQLQLELAQMQIRMESFSEKIELSNGKIIQVIPQDTSQLNRSDYRQYLFPYDIKGQYAYRLNVKMPGVFILKQMSGMLITSLLLIILLIVTYYYLLKVILKQRSLDEIKNDFINNMTHELKTPISIVYAANDALLNYRMMDDPQKREQYLLMAQEQLIHLTGLVEEILTLSVEERKNLKLNKEPVRLSDLFLSLKKQYLLQPPKAIEIQTHVNPEDLSVKVDKTHFRNVLCNLIENAIKYSGESVCIILSATTVRKGNTTGISITISDNGIGIPSQSVPKLFDKFYRVPAGNIHHVKGYGLGLPYVKTVVEKHGGTISVKSKEGKGSRFEIMLNKTEN